MYKLLGTQFSNTGDLPGHPFHGNQFTGGKGGGGAAGAGAELPKLPSLDAVTPPVHAVNKGSEANGLTVRLFSMPEGPEKDKAREASRKSHSEASEAHLAAMEHLQNNGGSDEDIKFHHRMWEHHKTVSNPPPKEDHSDEPPGGFNMANPPSSREEFARTGRNTREKPLGGPIPPSKGSMEKLTNGDGTKTKVWIPTK